MTIFHLKIMILTALENCSILHGCVFVMSGQYVLIVLLQNNNYIKDQSVNFYICSSKEVLPFFAFHYQIRGNKNLFPTCLFVLQISQFHQGNKPM